MTPMEYFMIESVFRDPSPVGETELERLIREHQRYLDKGFAEGWILVSGPKAAGGGGVILMKGASAREVEAYFDGDPMKIAGVQDYRIVEFRLYDCQAGTTSWFEAGE